MKQTKAEELRELEEMVARVASRLLQERDRNKRHARKISRATNNIIREVEVSGIARLGVPAIATMAGGEVRKLRFACQMHEKEILPHELIGFPESPEMLLVEKYNANKDSPIAKRCDVLVKFSNKDELRGSGYFLSFTHFEIGADQYRIYIFHFDGIGGPVYTGPPKSGLRKAARAAT